MMRINLRQYLSELSGFPRASLSHYDDHIVVPDHRQELGTERMLRE